MNNFLTYLVMINISIVVFCLAYFFTADIIVPLIYYIANYLVG